MSKPDSEPLALDHYRLLGRSGLRVSPLCLGTMTFGTEWGWGCDESTSQRIIETYLERGGNFIDTANFYTHGASEAILGRVLQGRRDQVVMATKYSLNLTGSGPGGYSLPHVTRPNPNAGGNHRLSMVRAVEASLQRLRTDYIDILYLHMWEGRTPIEEVMRAFDDLVRQGKVLYLGVSDTPAWKVAEANTLARLMGWSPFIVMQMKHNLIERSVERELIPMAIELGLGHCPWAPLEAGLLTGKYGRQDAERKSDEAQAGTREAGALGKLDEPRLRIIEELVEVATEVGRPAAQVALNWLLQQPGVTSPIIGARTVEQLESNLGCLDVVLSQQQMERLTAANDFALGFPHEFLASENVGKIISGSTQIESRKHP